MEETAPFKRTKREQKQIKMYINAVLYNMLLHHDVVRVKVPFFFLPPTTSITTLLMTILRL